MTVTKDIDVVTEKASRQDTPSCNQVENISKNSNSSNGKEFAPIHLPRYVKKHFNQDNMVGSRPLFSIDCKRGNDWTRQFTETQIEDSKSGIYGIRMAYQKFPEEWRRLQLHFHDGEPMKLVLDIDYKYHGIPMSKGMIEEVVLGIVPLLKRHPLIRKTVNVDKIGFVLYDNSRPGKISYHLLIHGFWFTEVAFGSELTNWVIDELDRTGGEDGQKVAALIDAGIYRKKGSLRFWGSHKKDDLASVKRIAKVSNPKFLTDKVLSWECHFHSGLTWGYEVKLVDKEFVRPVPIMKKRNQETQEEDDVPEDEEVVLEGKEEKILGDMVKSGFSLEDECVKFFNAQEDRAKFELGGVDEKGPFGYQRRMKTLARERFDCPCCGKKNSDQNHTLGFVEEDGKVYACRRCFHAPERYIRSENGFELDEKTRLEIAEKKKEMRRTKFLALAEKCMPDTLPFDESFADYVCNSRYLNIVDFVKQMIQRCNIIASEPGTGKTKVIRDFIQGCVIMISNKRAYSEQILKATKDLDFVNYLDLLETPEGKERLRKNPPRRLIISIESLHLLNLNCYSNFRLVFDESEALLSGLNSSTLYGSNELRGGDKELKTTTARKCLENLARLFRDCSKALVLDGYMTRKTYDFCTQMFGRENMYVVYNKFKNTQFDVTDHVNMSGLEDQLYDSLGKGRNEFLCIARKETGMNLQDRIGTKFPELKDKILYVNGDDTENEGVRILLDNERLKEYRVVMISPKVINGVSIDLKDHFHSVYLVAETKSCCDRDMCQMIGRVRHRMTDELHLYCEETINPSISIRYRDVARDLQTRHMSCVYLANINHLPDVRMLENPILKAITSSILEYNMSQACLKPKLIKFLEFLGCKITKSDKDPKRVPLSEERKEEKRMIKLEKEEKILESVEKIMPKPVALGVSKAIKSKVITTKMVRNIKKMTELNKVYDMDGSFRSLFMDLDIEKDHELYTLLDKDWNLRMSILKTGTGTLPSERDRNFKVLFFLKHKRLGPLKEVFMKSLEDHHFRDILGRLRKLFRIYDNNSLEDTMILVGVRKLLTSMGLSGSLDTMDFERETLGCYPDDNYNELWNISPKSFMNDGKKMRIPTHGNTPKQKSMLLGYLVKYLFGYDVYQSETAIKANGGKVRKYNTRFVSPLDNIPIMDIIASYEPSVELKIDAQFD